MSTDKIESLTARQHQVAAMLCCGKSMKQIAHTLHLSTRTIEGACVEIFLKLGNGNRAVAIYYLGAQQYLGQLKDFLTDAELTEIGIHVTG